MKRSKTFLLITILFLFVSSVFAQQTSYEIITFKDEMFGKPIKYVYEWEGLTFDIQYGKVIGLDGKLWMGGKGEVSRLDGDTWKTFTLNDILSGSIIYPEAISPDGTLWFTTSSGMKIYCFNGETWNSFFLWHEGMPVPPKVTAVGYDGVVWCGGGYGVLFYYKDDTWTKTVVDFAIGNALIVNDLTFDSHSILYAATNGGVYKYTDDKWINTSLEGMEQDDAEALAVEHEGKVWVGTRYGEVSWFDGYTWTKIVEFTELQRKVRYVNDYINYIITLENSYFSSKGEYMNFEFGEDCEPIGWTESYKNYVEEQTGFEYSFQDSIITAREKVDINGDGDTADGLTYSISRIRGVILGSDITWDDRYGEGPSGKMIYKMDFNSYGVLWVGADYSEVLQYYNGKWEQFTNDDIQDDKPTSIIGIAHDGVIWLTSEKGVWQLIPTPTNVEKDDNIPLEFAITGNYPNPFNPTTTIEFTIPETGFVNLSIYNITGQKILELVADTMKAGTHSVTWDGKDENGMMVSSGIYISRLTGGGNVTAGRMLLMK